MDVKPCVAVVGAGLIGRSWAIIFAGGGCDVALYDSSAGVAESARALVMEGLADLAEHGLVADAAAHARVRVCATLTDALHGATFVQENTPESIEAKREIFAELDRLAAPNTILASSTSTIVASQFTEGLTGRHRCLVAHPVNPPHLVPLVELVAAPWTAPATVTQAKAIYEAVGQVPIVVNREIEGFILNRLQAVLLSEAFRLVENGYVTPQDLDKTSQRWARTALVVHGAVRDRRAQCAWRDPGLLSPLRAEPCPLERRRTGYLPQARSRSHSQTMGQAALTRTDRRAHALARLTACRPQGAQAIPAGRLIPAGRPPRSYLFLLSCHSRV